MAYLAAKILVFNTIIFRGDYQAVWAVRYDIDEFGSGVVDIIASPIRTAYHKAGSSKPSISINKAQADLVDQVNDRRKKEWLEAGGGEDAFVPIRKSFRAMQDSWAWFAQDHLSPHLERGDPKEQTRREHLFPEEFKEALKAAAEFGDFEAKAEEMARNLVRMQDEAEKAARDADTKRRDEERKRKNAQEERLEAEQATQQLKLDQNRIKEALEGVKATLRGMLAQKEELRHLEGAIASETARLVGLRQQADQILDRAQSEAASLLSAAKDQAAKIIQEVVAAWPQFNQIPQPFKQAMNHYTGLLDVIKDFFGKVELKNTYAYRNQVEPNECADKGDPPPVLELIMTRAQKRIQTKNDLINAPGQNGPNP